MKIILSPAKKMITDTDSIAPVGMPDFLDKTTKILSWMKSLEKEELKAIWKCNDKIARQNFDRLENMDLYHMLTPAILSYEGIAFQYMAPAVFEDGQFEYIQKHLRILSAFYGSLKPLDGVKPYRLEMQAKDTYITITFCELSGEKLVTKGTYAKMARGEMVRFMAERGIENPADIQEFNRLGYRFREDLSSEKEYIFERLSAL